MKGEEEVIIAFLAIEHHAIVLRAFLEHCRALLNIAEHC